MRRLLLMCLALGLGVGCESEAPDASEPLVAPASTEARMCKADGAEVLPVSLCAIPSDFYTPRDAGTAGERYPACISDDNAYHPFQASVPSNARLMAIESILKTLGLDGSKTPSPADFEQARLEYTQPEGVDSRVQRREDIHYPEAPKLCRDMTAEEAAQYPDRCVGPARIIPLLNDAFARGIRGESPVVQAARIEAALIWFMYVSYYKESLGCGKEQNQCDSTSAYWGGQQDRDAAPAGGLGRYVYPLSPEAYERGWDAVLAMRCWKALDNPDGESGNKSMEARVGKQVDLAGDQALALIVRHRLLNLSCVSSWESLKILGAVLDRAATAADPVRAKELRDELAKADPATVDHKAAIAAIDAVFFCR